MEITKRRRLSAKERKQIYDKYNGHCAYCGTEITKTRNEGWNACLKAIESEKG